MTLNGVMAVILRISANSGSFRAHCVKVHVRYLISWWVLVRAVTRRSPLELRPTSLRRATNTRDLVCHHL